MKINIYNMRSQEGLDVGRMLSRMYFGYFESRNIKAHIKDYKDELISIYFEPKAYIPSPFGVEGDELYNFLRKECGVHRVCRISPFDEQKRRHTTFTKVAMSDDNVPFDIVKASMDEMGYAETVRNYVFHPYIMIKGAGIKNEIVDQAEFDLFLSGKSGLKSKDNE